MSGMLAMIGAAESIKPNTRRDFNETSETLTVFFSQEQIARHAENAANLDAQITRIGAPERALMQARQEHEGSLWSEIGASLDPALWRNLHDAQDARDASVAKLDAAERAYDAHQASRPRSLEAVPKWADTGRKLEREVMAYTEIVTEARRLYQTAADAVYAAFTTAVAHHSATAQQTYQAEDARHRTVVAASEQRVSEARTQVQAAETLAQRLRERGTALFEEG